MTVSETLRDGDPGGAEAALGMGAVGAHGRDRDEVLAGFKIERRAGFGDPLHGAAGLQRQWNREQHDRIFGAAGNVVGNELRDAMFGDFRRARGRLAEIIIEGHGDNVNAVRRGRRRRALDRRPSRGRRSGRR